jgi:hypothetical protein
MEAGIEWEIRVRGRLGGEWSPWFDGLTIRSLESGESQLTGRLADQAALFGVLTRIRDLGLELIALQRVERAGPPR